MPKVTKRDQVAGNAADYVAEAPSGYLFNSVVGSFPTVLGVTSETGEGVPTFNNAGILGPNEYTLQVNTNFYHSAACGGYTLCLAWQQYVMSTNTPVSLTSGNETNETEVFIEYWLLNYGSSTSSACPDGFINGGNNDPGVNCVQNTPATFIANGQLPITDLASLTLSGSATTNGIDAATVTFDGSAYTATVNDSYTDIASGWNQAEFNVLGNAGGSEAVFNNNSSITVNLNVTDGSTAAPTCVPPSSYEGTTGETNNLTLSATCSANGGSAPSIQFVESIGTPPPPAYSGSEYGSAPATCVNYVGSFSVTARQTTAGGLNWQISGGDGATVTGISYSIADSSGTVGSGTISGASGTTTTSRLPVSAPTVSGSLTTSYQLPSRGTGRCSVPFSFGTTN